MLFKDCGVEGSEDGLEKDQLKAYYEKYFEPENHSIIDKMKIEIPSLDLEDILELVTAMSPSGFKTFTSVMNNDQKALLRLTDSARHPAFIDFLTNVLLSQPDDFP